jgi:RsiW-degrading membrane proteinase PrsW (M82 family)
VRSRHFILTGWFNVACQVLFLLLLYVFGSRAPFVAAGAWHSSAVLLIVLVPSAVWTAFFYLHDHPSPEPSRHVIASFLVGMGAASAFALPIERDIFALDSWMYRSIGYLVLGSTLVRGALVSLLIYLGIRYGFLPSAEFDEPEDGMVYGAFIGSGFATVKSLAQLVPQTDFTLFAVGYTASTNILVYASTGSIVGYLVGRAKFGAGSIQRSSLAAVLAGSLLFGLYHTLNELVFLAGLPHAFWASFALSAAYASALLVIATRLMDRLTAPGTGSSSASALRLVPDWGVLTLVALLLASGAVTRSVATRATTFASDRFGIAFRYPTARLTPRLMSASGAGGSPLLVSIFTAGGDQGGPYDVSVSAKPERVTLEQLNPSAYLGRLDPVSFATENLTVSGKRAVRVKYSFVRDRGNRVTDFPEMRWAYTDIVPADGMTFVLSYQANPGVFYRQEHVYKAILNSVTWPTPRSAAR